jgi:hypothetical protein
MNLKIVILDPNIRVPHSVATSHLWLFKFKLNQEFNFSITLAIFQALNSHIQLVTAPDPCKYGHNISFITENSTERCHCKA